jgi:hypothetical protein
VAETPSVAAPPLANQPVAERTATQAVEAPRPPLSNVPRYADLSKEAIRRLTPAQQKRIYLERMTENNRRRQAEQAAQRAAAELSFPPPG